MEMCPNSRGARFPKSGSNTMRSVPAMVRMSSGEKRSRSSALGMKLAGMRTTSGEGHGAAKGRVHVALLENVGIGRGDGWKEGVRVDAHPDHQRDKGNDAAPLADVEIRHVMTNFFAGFTVEDALVEPEHVASGEDHTQGSEYGPGEVRLRGALKHQKFADEIVERGQTDAGQRRY